MSHILFICYRCQSIREDKQRKEEAEAQKRAKEEERRRREEEEEARRKAEEEEARRRMEEEERRKAMEEEARRRAEKEEETRKAQEAQKKREEVEKRLAREPQTREDLDIELVTEEMLDDNLSVQGTKESRRKKNREESTSSHIEEEQVKEEELDVETNGTVAEAGPQLDKKKVDEDLENQTLGWSDSKPGLLSGPTSNALTPTSPDQESDKQPPTTTSTSSNAEQNKVQISALSRSQSSKSQEKREQRRRRGLEHNQRESERAASSSSLGPSKDQAPPKSKSQEPSKLKERSDSKELDQYTFVEWKMKDDKGGKKEEKTSPSSPPPAGPVRPSTLALQPTEPVPERNGLGEGEGVVTLHRRLGAMKDKPEKWKARRSDGEYSASSPPPHDNKRPQLYVCFLVL